MKKLTLPSRSEALVGRDTPVRVPEQHFVNGAALQGPFDRPIQESRFRTRLFLGGGAAILGTRRRGTARPLATRAALLAIPTYEEVCSGNTGHTEVVQVVFDPATISYAELLTVFWESHDPTQGMRQGNDIGTQYRSAIYTVDDSQQTAAKQSLAAYQRELKTAGLGAITTEILPLDTYYFAEDYHQQYLAKNPGGYCGLGGTGVSCPVGLDLDKKSA